MTDGGKGLAMLAHGIFIGEVKWPDCYCLKSANIQDVADRVVCRFLLK